MKKLVAISVRENEVLTIGDDIEMLVKRRENRGNSFLLVIKLPDSDSVVITSRKEIDKSDLPPKPIGKLNP